MIRDTQTILRGTIGSEASFRGTEGTIVSGYGLVVGLDGTGSGVVPIGIRSALEQEMLKKRVGQGSPESGPLATVSPSQLIDSPNTAVVLVQAFIPAGLPRGAEFDVEVTALNGSGVTSLEGGRLYTTDLRRGVASPSAPDTRIVAQAKGPIFINPFAFVEDDPSSTLRISERTRGRILAGGIIKDAEPIRLLLDTPSHARAREITRAINNKFQTGFRGDIAVGRSEELIYVNVPVQYRHSTAEFINLLSFTRIDQTFPEEWGRRYAQALVEQPDLANELSWCLRALGEPAIPYLRPLYTHPESIPRLAAIEAGAWVGDLTVRPYIEELVESGPIGLRDDAMRWLTKLPTTRDPGIREFLREQLDNPDLALRISAFEALKSINDARIITRPMGNKFVLDIVPSSHPTIYITQSNTPRVVLFGYDLEVLPDAFVDVWDGRLLLKSEENNGQAEIFYRPHSRSSPRVLKADRDLASMIRKMAYKPTPDLLEDGLDMEYSEIVTVLYKLADSGAVPATFFPEDDRDNIENIRRLASSYADKRPELAPDDAAPFKPRDEIASENQASDEPESPSSPYVVPLPRPQPKETGREHESDPAGI
ncbi:MAG: flagellar basal body P-ring protein FlgI [Phycisphaerales bacterium JB065]